MILHTLVHFWGMDYLQQMPQSMEEMLVKQLSKAHQQDKQDSIIILS